MKVIWFLGGTIAGMIAMSLALAESNPNAGGASGEADVTEIQVSREAPRNYDSEMAALAAKEQRFAEKARSPRRQALRPSVQSAQRPNAARHYLR